MKYRMNKHFYYYHKLYRQIAESNKMRESRFRWKTTLNTVTQKIFHMHSEVNYCVR